ncbi:MAG: ComEC/Rec2 family competence protein [Candidatus Ancillula sp.]|jgi:competence protein ComEC|nr:ComEC/Rec2 family competence protein [Candidatus Ancillula sp.]
MRDLRLLIPAAALWVFALLKLLAPPTLAEVFLALLVGLSIFALFCQKFIPRPLVTQLAFCAILLAVQLFSVSFQQRAVFPDLVGKSTEGQVLKITSTPSISDSFGSTRCSYQAEGFAPHAFLTLTTKDDPKCTLDFGAQYIVSGKYQEDDFHMKNAATLESETVAPFKDASLIDQFCNAMHKNFLNMSESLSWNGPGLVPGMSLGDTRFMEKDLKDATKIAGLTHLTAISGAHFVIIISLIGVILQLLRIPRKPQAVLQIMSTFALVALVHPTDSVKRAAVMSLIGILAVFLNRRAVSISALGFAICSWLIFDPWLAVSFGFALSCSATAAIILFSQPTAQWLARYVGKTLGALLSIPIVAQVACTPILLLMTDYVTLYAPLANIIVIPAIEPATILSLLSCIFASINHDVALFIGNCANLFTELIAQVALIVAALPGAKIVWIAGPIGGLILLLLIGLVATSPHFYRFFYSRFTGFAPKEVTSGFNTTHKKCAILVKVVRRNVKRHLRLALMLFFGVASIFTVLFIFVKPRFYSSVLPTNWLIAACDVGQGDSTFVRTGENSAILVDMGTPNLSTGGELVSDCAEKLSVTTIDELQVSHYHDDHIGGLKNVVNKLEVKKALLNPIKQPDENWKDVVKLLEQKGVPIEYGAVGKTAEFGCGGEYCTKYQVLSIWDDASADGSIYNGGEALKTGGTKTDAEDDRENDSSQNLLFDVNSVKFWTAGDLETKGDKGALKAAQSNQIKDVDVVKANHHGSKTQSKPLNRLLNPKLALFNVGKNKYGHPAKETIDEFESLGAKTLRTDQNGICGVFLDADGNLTSFSER